MKTKRIIKSKKPIFLITQNEEKISERRMEELWFDENINQFHLGFCNKEDCEIWNIGF